MNHPMLEINSAAAREHGDTWLVRYDLQGVVDCCDRLLSITRNQSDDYTLLEALSSAALVKYVRCFGGGKRTGLREKDISDIEGDPLGVHRYFKDLRDKHIAHSVSPLEQVKVGVVVGEGGIVEGVGHIAGR